MSPWSCLQSVRYQWKKIAAKRIDFAGHSLLDIVRDVEKLKQLDHQDDKTAWMFMELCEHSDLNKL